MPLPGGDFLTNLHYINMLYRVLLDGDGRPVVLVQAIALADIGFTPESLAWIATEAQRILRFNVAAITSGDDQHVIVFSQTMSVSRVSATTLSQLTRIIFEKALTEIDHRGNSALESR